MRAAKIRGRFVRHNLLPPFSLLPVQDKGIVVGAAHVMAVQVLGPVEYKAIGHTMY